MTLTLSDALGLAGRLTDQPGSDTARERFRRFLGSRAARVDALGSLLDQALRSSDGQSRRALTDLVVTLGRHLGFEVTYGIYEPRAGAVRFDGAWRSPGLARIAVEVRTDRTCPSSFDDLSRTIDALPAVVPRREEEQTLGVCIVVPLQAAGRGTEAVLQPDVQMASSAWPVPPSRIRVVPLRTVLVLAADAEEQRISHAEAVVRLTQAGERDSDIRTDEDVCDEPPSAGPAQPSPHLSLVPKEVPPDYWVATIVADEGATPEQFVDAVISGRRLLGVSAIGIFPGSARAGDWVCFFLTGTGVVGHARLAKQMEQAAAPLRNPARFAAVFALADVELYGAANPLDPASPAQRLAYRTPYQSPGPFLSAISQREFAGLIARPTERGIDTVGTS